MSHGEIEFRIDGEIVGDIKDFETSAFVSKSQTTPKGLEHSDFTLAGTGEHDVINIPNVNPSAKSAVTGDNN